MKPDSRENILQEIAEAKQQIDHLRNKQEEAETTLQLLNERLFQYDKAKTHQTTNLLADSIPAATNISPKDKIALFRRLFRGREDVYPKLWQNNKTAKKGYSPACSNEWVRGVREKPPSALQLCRRFRPTPRPGSSTPGHLFFLSDIRFQHLLNGFCGCTDRPAG